MQANIQRPIHDYQVIPVGVPDRENLQNRVDATGLAAEQLQASMNQLAAEGYCCMGTIGAGNGHGPMVIMGRVETVQNQVINMADIVAGAPMPGGGQLHTV